jgi:hypothetical protein
MSNDPQGSGGRWWEIRGAGQPDEDEGGRRELMTDSRGRSRPERSLSVGADLAEEPRHPSRAYLWPVVSVIAAVGLILSVGYVVSTGKPKLPEKAMPAPPAVRGSAPPGNSAPGNREAKPDVHAKPDGESRPARLGPPPAPGDDPRRPPARPPADAPTDPGIPPGGPATNPGPVGPPSGNLGAAGGDGGTQPTGPPSPSTAAPPQNPPVKLDRPVPPAPSSARVRALSDTGGGCAKSTNTSYACTITHEAPYYLPGTTDPHDYLPAGHITLFRCQSDGPKYPVANRVNHWWAWLMIPVSYVGDVGVWVPVVFLQGVPSGDKPVPGLPLCEGASEPTTESTKKPAPKSTGSTPATKAPTSTTAPRTKSTADGNGA